MPLTVRQIESAKPADKDYKLSDGQGLYLLIKKSGARYWNLKYRFAGKEKKLVIGVYPGISLALARQKRDEWICPYISRHLLSLNPLLACCRRYSRGER